MSHITPELRGTKVGITHDITVSEYGRIHYWLRQNYGKPTKCEATDCNGVSKAVQWALVRGKKYEKVRENFIQLCRSCHTRYDLTEGGKKRISNARKGVSYNDSQLASRSIPVLQCSLDGTVLRRFDSIKEATKVTGVRGTQIVDCARGRWHTGKGFVWKYEGKKRKSTSYKK